MRNPYFFVKNAEKKNRNIRCIDKNDEKIYILFIKHETSDEFRKKEGK